MQRSESRTYHPGRRWFLKGAAAGVGAFVTARLLENRALSQAQSGRNIPQALNESPHSKEQELFTRDLQRDAFQLIDHISGPRQGHGVVPDDLAVAQSLLLLAQVQYGTNGRDIIKNTIQKRGLVIKASQDQTPQLKNVKEKPLTITIPVEATQADTFPFMYQLNNLINNVIPNALRNGLGQTNELTATVADSGVAAFQTSTAIAIFAASTPEHPTKRQVIESGTGAILSAAVVTATAFKFDAGGNIYRRFAKPSMGGAELGQSYDHLNPTFQKLGRSEYFQHLSNNLLRRNH